VAQALHRKANKPEVEAIMMKKAELSDLQRIIQAVENKIDLASFEALVRAVEMKPDRHELGHVLPSSYRGGMSDKQGVDLDKSQQYELDRRLNDLEKQAQLLNRDMSLQTEQVKQLVSLNLNSKAADFRDIDNMTHILTGKADLSKVQELVTAMKNEFLTQLSTLKKDFSAKSKKRE
jgi:hypothetical protein